jgi:amino acid adenylation domain-containing protein
VKLKGIERATLPGLFEAQVARTPEAVAVLSGSGGVTYGELNRGANRLAHWLIGRGAGPERLVALALPRSPQMVTAMLAVWKAGAACLPVDLDYPPERIQFLLADARPLLVLDDPALPGDGCPDTNPTDADRTAPLTPASPAYVIFTSGSTGRPKGVVVSHQGIPSLAISQGERLGVGPGSRILQFSSPGFDAYVWELCMALLSGGALVLAPPGQLLPGPQLAQVVARYGVTHLTLPPTVLAAVPAEERFPDGTTVVVAGEACTAALVERWASAVRLFNAYGPTEATVCVSISDPLAAAGQGIPPIGRPVDGVGLYVLDQHLQLVGPNTTGELYITGTAVARGYLHQPALTAQRFLACPFGPPGTRMYRTGDLARWRHDGQLEFIGRADDQIKLRGYRIEPGEIQATLASHPDVAQATVMLREDHPGQRRLVAYATPHPPDHPLDPAVLRHHLASRLPAWMLPTIVVVLQRLPLRTNGKLDRDALPPPDPPTTTGPAPRTPHEHLLCQLFAETLHLPTVNTDDDFFQLGGDSIVAIRVVSQARRAGLAIAPQDVLQRRTVAALAAIATPLARPEAGTRGAGTRDAGPGDALPLTPLQEGFLFHAHYDERAPDVYVVQAGYDIEGPLDVERLRRAATALLGRHPNLCASFRHQGLERPVQVLPDDVTLRWGQVDLTPLAPADREVELARLLAADRARRFDLADGPALRFTLVGLVPRRHRLVLTAHHIVLDGWSVPVLFDELLKIYAASGSTAGLPPVTPYREYLAWLAAQDREAARAAWRQALRGIEEPSRLAPAGPLRPPPLPERVSVELPESLATLLATTARGHGLTLGTVIQGAWAIVLARLTGRDDVVFGATVSGRPPEVAGIEEMVGLFINTVPVRLRVDPAEPLTGMLSRLQDEQARLAPHQHLGLADIQRLAGVGELFDTTTVFENYPAAPGIHDSAADAGLRVRESLANAATHYPLSLCATPGTRLRLSLDYHADRFDSAAARAILVRLRRVLEVLAATPDLAVGQLGVLDPEERRRVLVEWNDTAREVEEATLPELFERQVEVTPEAVAVLWGGGRLTYDQLNRRANRLAHWLIGLGAGPEEIVALAVPRGPEMVTAMLAVWKAGAACLPGRHPARAPRRRTCQPHPAVLPARLRRVLRGALPGAAFGCDAGPRPA